MHQGRQQLDRDHRQSDCRQQNQPIQHDIAQDDGDRGPRVGRKQPDFRGQIRAVLPQMIDRWRLAIGIGAPRAQLVQHLVRVTAVVQPSRQPRADIAAARNCRQIVEFLQQVAVGQRLNDAERKRCAANAAAGQRQCRQSASVRHAIDLAAPRLLILFDDPALVVADGQQARWGSCARIERRQFVQQGFRQRVWLGDLVRHGWTP